MIALGTDCIAHIRALGFEVHAPETAIELTAPSAFRRFLNSTQRPPRVSEVAVYDFLRYSRPEAHDNLRALRAQCREIASAWHPFLAVETFGIPAGHPLALHAGKAIERLAALMDLPPALVWMGVMHYRGGVSLGDWLPRHAGAWTDAPLPPNAIKFPSRARGVEEGGAR